MWRESWRELSHPLGFVNLAMWLFSGRCRSRARLDGKTAVITGCNTGIGKQTALDFVRRGARVIMACRDLQKAELAAEDIRALTKDVEGAGRVVVMRLDLASLASVRECARRLLETEQRIHLLINNAGVMACPKAVTEDGLEMQLAVNHLGHFLLTCLLLPRIIRSAPARIVNVSSLAHMAGSINFDDLNSEKSYSATFAYGQSKLANILFTKELAKRLKGTGVTTYSLHPGVVATELGRHFDSTYFWGVTWLFNNVASLVTKTPEQGAQTTIYCAVEESLAEESGLYYSDCKKTRPSAKARDDETARRLWEESARIVALGDWDPCTAEDSAPPSAAP
ncbi:retinol dehydrogenase 12-like [Bacillus rossius redtenbacheri]|uniref:retinol dehydrogenase 12-like n=1 Tax=Bacillus rossius redtenbacheri TaxID=93214 RepID=UPI002FDD92CF